MLVNMKYTITAKQCKVSEMAKDYIEKQLTKLDSFLPYFPPDGTFVTILVRKSHKHHLSHIGERISEDGETRSKESRSTVDHPIYYEGMIKLSLPIKPLVVESKGKSMNEVLANGFLLIHKELQEYKGKHFKGHSEYYDQRSIRKEGSYEEKE